MLPNHVAEIRLNNLDTHDTFEHSSVSSLFQEWEIKKIDRCMEVHKNQLIIGYD